MAEKDIILRINAITNKDVVEAYGETIDEALGTYEKWIKTTQDATAVIEGYNKKIKEGNTLTTEEIKHLNEEKAKRSEAQRLMRQEDKIRTSTNGSLKQQQLLLSKVNDAMRKLTDEQKKANPEFVKFQKALYDSVKEMNAEMGNFQMNVGNYPQLLQQILPVQGQVSNQLMQMAQSAGLSTGALGALGAALGVGTLAYKGFQQAMDLTQTVGDEVAIKMAGWESVWDKFIRTVVSADFTNFLQGLRDAKQAGEELAASLDELFERNNALRIAEAEASLSQEKNLQIMRDQTKTIEERKAAGEAYIQTERKLAKEREDIYRQEFSARLKDFARQTGMREEDVQFYIANYNRLRKAANQYGKEVEDINDKIAKKEKELSNQRIAMAQGYAANLSSEYLEAEELKEQNLVNELAQLRQEQQAVANGFNNLTAEEQRFFSLADKYNLGNDKITSALVNSWVNVETAVANGEKGIARAVTTVNSLTAQQSKQEKKKTNAIDPYAQALKELDDLVEEAENEVLPRLQQVEMPEDKRSPLAKWLGVTPEEFEKLKSQALSAAQSIYGSIQQLSQQATQQRLEDELEAVDKEAESEKAILKSKLDRNLISQKQYEKKLAEVDAEAEARREEANKEAFKKNKAWNIGQALMNMALAITNIWATNKGGAAARIAETVIATTTGLAQVAAIAAQKYARGGELHGASHAQGGIKGNVQGHNIELEGEEVVINKRSARKYRNALSWINSDNGWGVDFAGVRGSGGYTPQLKFARGGVLNSFDFSPSATPTSSSVQQAISKQASRVEELIMATNRRIDRLQVQVNISDIESASETKQVHISRATL